MMVPVFYGDVDRCGEPSPKSEMEYDWRERVAITGSDSFVWHKV